MRPASLRHSSDGSVALAHRRRLSQQAAVLSGSQIRHDGQQYPKDIVKRDGDEEWQEPTTIPGRLVHDILCLLAILVDFIECAVVIIYRVIIDMRYGQRDSLLWVVEPSELAGWSADRQGNQQAREDEEVLPLIGLLLLILLGWTATDRFFGIRLSPFFGPLAGLLYDSVTILFHLLASLFGEFFQC
jgi:hypothetical protein